MKIFNSLSRKVEEIEKKPGDKIGVYTCGPTVYDYVTIGNWRTYTLGDLVVRTLKFLGYDVSYVMNITDVGHLTGDNLGDADTGEDRLEKGAKREGKSAWEVAKFYADDFLEGFHKLNMTEPKVFCRATEHIPEQIELVVKIEKAGFVYKIADGIYFDTAAYEAAGNKYGELSTLDEIKVGARVEPVAGKKNPRDFALWKFSPAGQKRQMEWESPWGTGFPGWHIECSAMSMKYLGEQFDVHIGGEDLRSTHHPNEIAQAEAATGKKPFVHYWMHGAFLQVDGGRMGKSLGNAYTLQDIGKRGFSPMVLRYFYLTGHYRKSLNFTWEGLEGAKKSLFRLKDKVEDLMTNKDWEQVDGWSKKEVLENDKDRTLFWKNKFREKIEDDLNMPEALAVVWQMINKTEGSAPHTVIYELLLDFDRVLGLGLDGVESPILQIPGKVQRLKDERERLRGEKKFDEADAVRKQIEETGFVVEDTPEGPVVRKR